MGTARAGSYLLTSYLHSLPDVAMRGEVLNPDEPQGLRADPRHRDVALRHIRINLCSQSAAVSGVKILLGQLAPHGLTVADLCAVMPDTRFLIIYRRALAEQYVSMLIAKQTGSWNLTRHGTRRRVAVDIDPTDFRRYCEATRRGYRELFAHSGITQRALVVAYEALVADADGLFRSRVCPFLGVRHHPVRTSFFKQNPYALVDKVRNYDEVASLLAGPDSQQEYHLADGWRPTAPSG